MSDHTQRLLKIYRRNLEIVEEQAAIFGIGQAPLELRNQIDKLREQIVELEAGQIAPLGAPPRGKAGVLIDLAHGQQNWPLGERYTLFNLDAATLTAFAAPPPAAAPWHLHSITNVLQIDDETLAPWRGMIVAMPFEQKMAEVVRQTIVRWVHAGGRLLLLGYEMGERHHGSNINKLAHEFGLHFNADIVAPEGWQPDASKWDFKPYHAQIPFTATNLGQEQHALVDGVLPLTLMRLCTLTAEPGSWPLLTLGSHPIAPLPRDKVMYNKKGMLIAPNGSYHAPLDFAAWVPIMALAAEGLTGTGAVLALGTWHLFGPGGVFMQHDGNRRLFRNLLHWLAGTL